MRHCAIALRQRGFGSYIAMIGRETELPYARPPLSKEYLAKVKPSHRLYFRPPSFWADKVIETTLGTEVPSVVARASKGHFGRPTGGPCHA